MPPRSATQLRVGLAHRDGVRARAAIACVARVARTAVVAHGLLGGGTCGCATVEPTPRPSTAPAPASTSRALAEAARTRLDANLVTNARFATRTLFSWTSAAGAARLSHGPPLLRATLNLHPPDDAWYDLHVRESCDQAMATLLTSPPFRHLRYAWTNAWGAVDGVATEHYGDQLVRIELKSGAIVARFLPSCGAGDPLLRTGAALRAALPEWSFFSVDDGRELPRSDVLAHPERLAAVFHAAVRATALRCAATDACFFAYREVVVVNEAQVAAWMLGTNEIQADLDASRRLVEALIDADAIPAKRDEDDTYLASLAMRTWSRRDGFDALTIEDRWMLTLPFPRAQYRALPHLRALLDHPTQLVTVRGPSH